MPGVPAAKAGGFTPGPPGYLGQDNGKGFLTFWRHGRDTVQGGIPMTVQGKGAAPPPCKRPEVRLPTSDAAFILALNIPAGGSRRVNPRHGGR